MRFFPAYESHMMSRHSMFFEQRLQGLYIEASYMKYKLCI